MEDQGQPHLKRSKSIKKLKQKLDVNILSYTEETSIHGLKYLGKLNHTLAERIFWILIFIISTLFLGYFIYKTCKAWLENPIMITKRTTPSQIFDIPFPAVTVCPAIKTKVNILNLELLTDKIEMSNSSSFWSTDYGRKFLMASQICHSSFGEYAKPILDGIDKELRASLFRRQIEPEVIRTLYDISPLRGEVVKRCRSSNWIWEDRFINETTSDENCKSVFSTIITNEGLCFTFNTVHDVLRQKSLHTDFDYYDMTKERDGWDPDLGYTKDQAFPVKAIVKGSPSGARGLRFVLIGNWSDLVLECEPANIGYKLVLNSPAVYPHIYEKYLTLEYGKEYKILIKPKTIYTADDLRSFDPETRQCYFNDERRLKYYTFYNAENCRLECYANFTLKLCGGAPFSSPRDANITNLLLPQRNYAWDLSKYYASINDYNKQFPVPKDLDYIKDVDLCNCLPECNSILYEYEIVNSHDDVGYEGESVEDYYGSDEIKRTIVDMYFSDTQYIGENRVRVYTFEKLLSDFGGLVGLFMGGSVLSLFELIYFLTIRNCFKK